MSLAAVLLLLRMACWVGVLSSPILLPDRRAEAFGRRGDGDWRSRRGEDGAGAAPGAVGEPWRPPRNSVTLLMRVPVFIVTPETACCSQLLRDNASYNSNNRF